MHSGASVLSFIFVAAVAVEVVEVWGALGVVVAGFDGVIVVLTVK